MNNIFEKAVIFAMEKHNGQVRKNGGIYILHPLEAATIVGTMTNDFEVLAAAVLHDVVEDSDVIIDDILKEFGPRVATLVSYETEDKYPGMDQTESWKMRKIVSIEKLKRANDVAVKMIWLGDKLANMRAISREYDELGDKLFERFHEKDPMEHCWYYYEILNNIEELKEYSAYKEYKSLLNQVFGKYRKEL